jgi:uncharacterized protein (DUF169 family)
MNSQAKERFIRLWRKYFDGAELPVTFWYSDTSELKAIRPVVKPPEGHHCVIADIAKVRRGKTLAFDAESFGCGGGQLYFGFRSAPMPDFEYFLSTGIPGKMEGERYKKSPELVREVVANRPTFTAPGRYAVFKRWDVLSESDHPEAVIFFAYPDVLSGVFTLFNFDESEFDRIICPFAAGCSSIVQYPYLENESERPRAILGMFDVSARPCVPMNVLSLAVPMKRFERMIDNMEESFLITASWSKVRRRISAAHKK